MLKKLIINIGSGYALKVVQIFCSLITVPILISDKGLGLNGYGKLAVALSLSALMSMLFDGFRLIASKSIGRQHDLLYVQMFKVLQIFIVLSAPVLVTIALLANPLIPFLGLVGQPVAIVYLVVVYFVFEQLLYVVEQYYHSQVKTFVVNISNGIEAVVRLFLILIVFTNHQGTQSDYLLIFIATYLCKLLNYLIFIIIANTGKHLVLTSFSEIKFFIKEAFPLSLRGVSSFLVFRMSIIYANKYLSSEAAAVFSIIFVTTRGYLTQIFVNVMRPMVIPVVSRISFASVGDEKLTKYKNIISFYEYLALSSISLIACFTPLWLPLWLGDSFRQYQALFAFAVGILGIESAFSLKSLVLVSQNLGSVLAKYSIVACTFFLIVLFFLEHYGMFTLSWMTFCIIAYVLMYNGLSVNHIFNNSFGRSWRSTSLVFVISAVLLVNYLLFYSERNIYVLFGQAILSSALLLTCITAICWISIKYAVSNMDKFRC